ncbi:DeoR/GlpR transcriptional regulator [Vagococcus humatus]|uniref:DeoR/GlpR transcriptional regulator n=1 Tax=Vagococcus humatus TaxID=1889241 RepID=A0A429Z6R6_9ENTE|nr:DeoR/GlpR transcriptional regulator [Vagococcus humatus]
MKVGDILIKYDRLQTILELLDETGSVKVTDLSQLLNVTEETVRKDLDTLEQQKKLKRVRGGAFKPNTLDKEVPVLLRETMYQEEKSLMAKHCLKFIEDGDAIALDSSTTCLSIATELKKTELKITVISNSIDIFNVLKNHHSINLIGIGGNFRSVSHSFVGMNSQSDIARYLIDKSFISSSGLSLNIGPTDNNEAESLVRRQFLKQSQQNFLVVDHTKFDFRTIHLITDFSLIHTIITDKKPDNANWSTFLTEKNIQLIY